METMRTKMAHPQPPDRRGDYVFEDGRAAHFFDVATNYTVPLPGPEHIRLILYSASKYGCSVTGPGITDEMQIL